MQKKNHAVKDNNSNLILIIKSRFFWSYSINFKKQIKISGQSSQATKILDKIKVLIFQHQMTWSMLSTLSKSVIFSTKITVKMSLRVTSSSLSSLHNEISLQYKILNHFFLMVCLFFCKYDILYVCYLDIIWFSRLRKSYFVLRSTSS